MVSDGVARDIEAPNLTAAALDLMPLKSNMGAERLATPAGGVIDA